MEVIKADGGVITDINGQYSRQKKLLLQSEKELLHAYSIYQTEKYTTRVGQNIIFP